MLAVRLSRAASFEYLHVPFQGTAPSIQSLLGSQIASCISPIGSFVPHVRAGTLRALATLVDPKFPTEAAAPAIGQQIEVLNINSDREIESRLRS
jgi:tripartite-type tricarboxylate transporter receptor subunit TctC